MVTTAEPRLSHGKSRLVTLEDMESIPSPSGTETWRPVPHREVVAAIHESISSKGLLVAKEEYSVTHDDQRLYGVLKLQESRPGSEWSRCIGIRTGNDRVLALGISLGISVFVCDNGCFSGERLYHRRHTANFNIGEVIDSAFADLDSRFGSFESRLQALKGEPISRDGAAALIVKVAEDDGIRAIDILPILQEFQKPRHEEFSAQNRWSLLNAFTEISKRYNPARYARFQKVLAEAFQLG